jgi:hypothetical protein
MLALFMLNVIQGPESLSDQFWRPWLGGLTAVKQGQIAALSISYFRQKAVRARQFFSPPFPTLIRDR